MLQFAPYCTSKWAVEGLSKCIAKGLPEGMATVALNPGTIYTDMLALCMGELASQFQSPDKWYGIISLLIFFLHHCNVIYKEPKRTLLG